MFKQRLTHPGLSLDCETDWIHAPPAALPTQQTATYPHLFDRVEDAIDHAPHGTLDLLDQVTRDSALRLSNTDTSPVYIARAPNGLLECWERGDTSAVLDFDGWFKIIYQSQSLYITWAAKAVSEKYDHQYEFVDPAGIGPSEVVNTIAGADGETPLTCCRCGDGPFDSVHNHADHVWTDHEVAHELTRYRC